MASTYRTIEELYRTTLVALSESPEAWKAFLESAGRNYKLPFPEQALVHAQRPDAKAVLELERWDALFGRRVKRGSVGIAVFGAPWASRSSESRARASCATTSTCRTRRPGAPPARCRFGLAARSRRRPSSAPSMNPSGLMPGKAPSRPSPRRRAPPYAKTRNRPSRPSGKRAAEAAWNASKPPRPGICFWSSRRHLPPTRRRRAAASKAARSSRRARRTPCRCSARSGR